MTKVFKINTLTGIIPSYKRDMATSEACVQGSYSKIIPGAGARAHFPFFSGPGAPNSHYLDSAASAQKPKIVIDTVTNYLSHLHANIHRGAYALSANATELYDGARSKVAKFIGARSPEEVIFTKGATEAFNLVASSYCSQLKKGDVILLTLLEHHSNIVPWQLAAARVGAKVVFADIDNDASLNLTKFQKLVSETKPKIVSFTGMSNAFGSLLPIEEITRVSHAAGAVVMVDGAQAAVHMKVDVAAWNVDFMAIAGHKLYGPTGIGALYGKKEILSAMEPYQGGGDMIQMVTTEGSTWAEIPSRFEAGTPPIAEAIGLGTAVDFISGIGMEAISHHDEELFGYGFELLSRMKGVTLYGPATNGKPQRSIVPFTVSGVHPHDISTIVDSVGVQIRAGHHCAMPALKRLGIQSSARASIGLYSTKEDFDALAEGILRAQRTFA